MRILARADASLAQLLLYHYVNSANIAFTAPESERERFYRATIQGRHLWGDSVNPVDPDLRLTPDGDGYRLDGLKRFSTGVSAGDVALVNAVIAEGPDAGTAIAFVIERDRDGVEPLGDWDYLGQRQSASGSVRFSSVRVEREDLLGPLTDEPFATLITPSIQLGFGNLYLGIAEEFWPRPVRSRSLGRTRGSSAALSATPRTRSCAGSTASWSRTPQRRRRSPTGSPRCTTPRSPGAAR